MHTFLQPYKDKIKDYAAGRLLNLEINVPTADDLKDAVIDLRDFLHSVREAGIWAANERRKDGFVIILKRRAAR